MSLRELIAQRAPIADVAKYLDALAADVRMLEANALPRRDQAQLFDMAADSPPIRVSHFVPDDVPAQKAVHHPGRNTVPVPTYFKHFQKRFMKSAKAEHEGLIGGYNASNAFFIRPGYFVGYETDGKHLPADKQSMQNEWFARGARRDRLLPGPRGLGPARGLAARRAELGGPAAPRLLPHARLHAGRLEARLDRPRRDRGSQGRSQPRLLVHARARGAHAPRHEVRLNTR
jgi:hypothetical protein